MEIATLTGTSNTLDTIAKLVRVMEKTGVTYEQFVLPINSRTARNNLADYLKAGCPKMTAAVVAIDQTTLAGYELASAILGKDFIQPDEVAISRRIVYSADQLESFENTLPEREELEWLRDNGFMLVPGPAQPMTLLEIRDSKPEYFYSKTEGWYADDKQRFSHEEKVTTKWLKLRKGPVPNSTSRNWGEQNKLVSDVECVPNAAEVAWAVTTYKAVRNIYLLPSVYVRTSSVDSDGDRVSVGLFDARGLDVDYCWDYDCDSNLGLASARQSSLSQRTPA